MTLKKLQVLLLVLLFGCTPGIKKIYKKVQTPGSGYIYLCNMQSIQDELSVQQDALDKITNDKLKILLQSQNKITGEIFQCMQDYKVHNQVMTYNCFKPPNPCPPPPPPPTDISCLISARFIIFFTRSVWDDVEIHKNGKLILVLKKSTFIDLTKTQIVCVPRKLSVNSGDTVVLKLPVEYRDSTKNIQRRKIEYKEIIPFLK